MNPISVAPIEAFKGKFGFIPDPTFKTNLAIEMQYISYMAKLADERLPGTVKYTVYKDIIVHTGCIIESLLSYKLQKMLHEGQLSPATVTFKIPTASAFKEIYVSPAGDFVIAQFKQGYKEDYLKATTNFKNLNAIARKVGLIRQALYVKCEEIREKRNKIHLIALADVEDKYQKQDIEDIFKTAAEVIAIVR